MAPDFIRVSSNKTHGCFCLVPVVNGGWGDWSEWSACSVSCGPGTSLRTRRCDSPAPGPGGSPCVGLPVSNKLCDLGPCPGSKYWHIVFHAENRSAQCRPLFIHTNNGLVFTSDAGACATVSVHKSSFLSILKTDICKQRQIHT